MLESSMLHGNHGEDRLCMSYKAGFYDNSKSTGDCGCACPRICACPCVCMHASLGFNGVVSPEQSTS